MNDPSTAFHLSLQLGVAFALVLLMTVIHSVGLIAITRILRLEDRRLVRHAFNVRAVALLGGMGLLLFALHIGEIFVFAFFYIAVGAMQTLEQALYYSASAYATLGWTAEFFPRDWRLIGALEALIGFILIGWSTAFMANTMRKLAE